MFKKTSGYRQPLGLAVGQQQLQPLHVGCVDDVAFAQAAFPLPGLLRQDMTGERLGVGILAAPGPFEPFRRCPIGFYLGHNILLTKN